MPTNLSCTRLVIPLMAVMRRMSLVSGGLLLIALLGLRCLPAALAQDTSTPAPSSASQTLKGQLVMMAGEVAIIKDGTGKTTHLSLSKATKIERGVKDGDMVEVSVSSDGQALAIKPSN